MCQVSIPGLGQPQKGETGMDVRAGARWVSAVLLLLALLLPCPSISAAAAVPTAVSVTPSSGTGSPQTFSLLYSDADGVSKISYVQALINGSFSWQNPCALLYLRSSNGLYLVNDAGNGWQGPLTPGVAGTLQNKQCTLDAGASSVTAAGTDLTVNGALSFKADRKSVV